MIEAKEIDVSQEHIDLFLGRLVKANNTDCWTLSRGRGSGELKYNYRSIQFKGRVIRGHRLSLYIFNGIKVPKDKMVCHRCDNKLCVNPNHLYVGDAFTNMKDAAARGLLTGNGYSKRTHCFAGHDYNVVGFHKKSNGGRQCIACMNNYNKQRKLKL